MIIEEKILPVNAKKFTYEIIISKGKGKLTRNAENMIIILATNAIRKKPFYNPDDKDDCLQLSLFNMFNNWHNFNPDKTDNAFAYFTEIAKRSWTEMLNFIHNKKGLKPGDQKNIKLISMNSINIDGGGMYNL